MDEVVIKLSVEDVEDIIKALKSSARNHYCASKRSTLPGGKQAYEMHLSCAERLTYLRDRLKDNLANHIEGGI